jgi:hypothetical protein
MAEKKKVFISYKRNVEPDEPIALEVFTQLSKDHDVFIDLKMMVGTKWSKEIKENLLESDFFISLISENSIKSDMVSTEIQIAYKHSRIHGKPVILPVRLNYFEDLEYDLTAYLDSRNYLTWKSYSDTQEVITQLLQAINGDRFSDEKVLDIVKQRVKDKENLIRKLLSNNDFNKARVECENLLEQNNEAHLVHLFLAVVLLIEKETGIYPRSVIKRIEKHLGKACENEKVMPTAMIVWGIIKHDHYFLVGLSQGEPSLIDIQRILENINPDTVDIDLLELVEIDSITFKALGLRRFLKK